MPSPFPGMDPYLEGPRSFPDFHHRFVVHLQETIQSHLPPPYYAKTEQRVWIEWPTRSVIPDVGVVHAAGDRPSVAESGAIAVLEAAEVDTETVDLVEGHEVRQLSLHVYAGEPGQPGRLVTAIELLSPSNKSPGEGREAYRRKQRGILERDVHLMELDLLRGGRHTTAVPRDALKRPFDYHVAVRDRNLPSTQVYSYPVRLEGPLPRLAVPLLPGEGYVTVELQRVFDRCYDTGSYRREIDYLRDEPDPPLEGARRAWARERIDRWLKPPA